MSSNSIEPQLPSPLEPFRLKHWPENAPKVWVKRDDLIHPIISGNKWRKLAYAELLNDEQVISIGGGYSNHLHALAFKCLIEGRNFTALVRGNYSKNPTPMLNDLTSWGCNIHYITKVEYARRDSPEFQGWLHDTFGKHTFIPEGGSTNHAVRGIQDMMKEVFFQSEALNFSPDLFMAPVASGATLAGMITGAKASQCVLGIAVLKGQDYLEKQVSRFLPSETPTWSINHTFTHDGYAKKTPALTAFCTQINTQEQLQIEPVYSGKVFFALDQLITNHAFKSSQNIVVIHTGGLQGARAS